MFFPQLLFLAFLGYSLSQQTDTDGRVDCELCDKSACPTDLSCLAELVLDRCSCCKVCAKVLGERCGGPDSIDGRCADEYICAGKSVYEPVKEGGIGQCVCKSFDEVCGSDGVVYENECELKMESYGRVQRGLSAIEVDETDALCLTPPFITSPPKDAFLKLDSQSELSCEATGRPIPDIIWTKDGEELPGNHINIATRKRNGPTKFGMTSWVLLNVSPNDGGTYMCKAKNSQGETSVSVTISVSTPEEMSNNNGNDVAIEL